MPRIAFRIDASQRSSPSRIRRSLALAYGLKESDASCAIEFLVSGHESAWAIARDSGFGIRHLGNGHLPSWNLEATSAAIDGSGTDMLVVDDPCIDERFLREMREKAFVALIDDSGRLKSYDAHAIVNPNINAHLATYPQPDGGALLLGTEFAALPQEFDGYQDSGRENPEKARRIFVSFPGADHSCATLSAVRVLKSLASGFLAEIVVSPDFLHGEALAREIGLDDRFIVISGEAGRAKRMAASDIAICSPSSTFYECLFLGLPTALLLESGAEAPVAEYAAMEEFALHLSEAGATEPAAASRALGRMMEDKAARDRTSARTAELVDGLGRFRLADELLRLCAAGKSGPLPQ